MSCPFKVAHAHDLQYHQYNSHHRRKIHDLMSILSSRVIPAEYEANYEGLLSSRRVAAIVDGDGE